MSAPLPATAAHPSHGEEIKAVLVENKNHADVTEEPLMNWSKDQLAASRYRRVVEFVNEPMTTTGKMLKRELT